MNRLHIILFTEGGGSGEESDVLSINADADDSDIEGPREEQTVKAADAAASKAADSSRAGPQPAEANKDIQSDIDRSVSEILAFSSTSAENVENSPAQDTKVSPPAPEAGPVSSHAPAVCQPSVRQLELLELEMRARAIKALMKASSVKKLTLSKNV